MRSIQIDEEVYQALEAQVRGFGDTPNAVLRRVLGVKELSQQSPPRRAATGSSRKRGKAPKTNLTDLVRIGSLSEGQILFMHDYQGNKLDGVSAKVCGNDLEYDGKQVSMSALTRKLMQQEGYQSDSYRGPQFWYTAEGKSVKVLWDEYLHAISSK